MADDYELVFCQRAIALTVRHSLEPCTGAVSCRWSASLQEAVSTSESSGRLYPQVPKFVNYRDSKRLQLGPRALYRHRTSLGRAEVQAPGPFSPVFRWPERCAHFQLSRCSSGANPYASRYPLVKDASLHAILLGGHQQ